MKTWLNARILALLFAASTLVMGLNVSSVAANSSPVYMQTLDIYEYSVGGTISWVHTYDGSVGPIKMATLTIVADDVDGPGDGMDGEQDMVFFNGHFLGLLNDLGYYTNWNYEPGPGNSEQPLTTTTFILNPAWIALNMPVVVEIETGWGVEIETSSLGIACQRVSTILDPKDDQGTGPSYGDIMKAQIFGPVGFWTGSEWVPAIYARMQVHGRIPDAAPLCMPDTIACFSWRFDYDGEPGFEMVILVISDGAPGDPDPGAGTWSLIKWSPDDNYQPLAGQFRIIHNWWPGWGDVDRIEVLVPLTEIGTPIGFNWMAMNTYWPAWWDYAPDAGLVSW